jgi:uncharacterized membrane protein YdfJ with MMPL/SSD domain
MESLLTRLAAASGRRPWWWIGAWTVAFVVFGVVALQTQSVLSNGGFDVPGSQSATVVTYFEHQPESGAQPFTFLVDAATANDASRRIAIVEETVHQRVPIVVFPLGPVASGDRRTLSIVGFAAVSQSAAFGLARHLKRVVQVPTGATRTFVLGPAASYETYQRITTSGLARAEAFTALPLVVVLVVVFGSVIAALVPLTLAVLAVVITFGLTYFAASHTEVSIFATTMISMIGIGVAVDYSMFILARFREELAQDAATADAVTTAMRTSGTAVVFSGITVVLSLLSIVLVPVRAVQSMAAAAAAVTIVAVLAAATFLPAFLHLLGPRVNSVVLVDWGARRHAVTAGFWLRWTRMIMRHPVPALTAGVAILVVLALPALTIRTANTSVEQLPTNDPIQVGSRLLTSRITGPGRGREGAVTILVEARPGDRLARLAAPTAALANRVRADPLIETVSVQQIGTALVVIGLTRVDPESEAATLRLVPRIRQLVADDALARRAIVSVGGVSAFQRDLNEEVGGDLWKVIVFVAALAYIVLLVLLRSVLLPLKAVVLNLLSIGAAYGVVVAIFQWGALDWTGYRSLGHVSTLTPALILAITFGLSMDYEVFLLSRIKERYELHGSNERAVAEGIAASARLITSAAAIMVIVFLAFVFTGLPSVKEIGAGLAVAIAIDATITRLVLVPATMRLFGDWNWWLPGVFERYLPQIAHETRRPAAVD